MKKGVRQTAVIVFQAYDMLWRLLEKRNAVMALMVYLTVIQPAWAASDFATGIRGVLGIATWVAYAGCAFFMYELIMHWRSGGSFGRDIIGVLLCAGAICIVKLVFKAFGLDDAAVDPSFSHLLNGMKYYEKIG